MPVENKFNKSPIAFFFVFKGTKKSSQKTIFFPFSYLIIQGNIYTFFRYDVQNLEGLLDQLEIVLEVHYYVSTPKTSWKMTNIRDRLSFEIYQLRF